jgi:hypothetical protein
VFGFMYQIWTIFDGLGTGIQMNTSVNDGCIFHISVRT